MSRKRNLWQRRQAKDTYVKAAQRLGLRSRAAFKLRQLDESAKLFKPGMRVLDLGAAPGGWSQYAASKVGCEGCVVAVDLLEMPGMRGVQFIRGDVRQPPVMARARCCLGGHADLVISDMAPNITGVASVDMPRAYALAETALAAAQAMLDKNGALVVKLFHGEGFDKYVAELGRHCRRVSIKKPAASRRESREIYAVARF